MLWVTGAKGLLGSALCAKCKAALHLKPGAPNDASSVGSCIAALHLGFDILPTGKEVDIANWEAVRGLAEGQSGIRYIVNAAGFSQVDPAEERREEAYRANVVGPENLARLAREIGARLIHISTDYVFPGNVMRPLKEEDPVGPCNYYGETKLEGERRALELGACVIRVSWLFGHGGKNFVSKMLELLQTQKEIQLTADHWNRPTYAPDFAEAILAMLDQNGLYQYANQGVASKYEFGAAMREEAIRRGYKVVTESIVPVSGSAFPSPCRRPVYSAFDTTKIEQHVPIRHWKEALRDFLCAPQPASL